jgi:hypothetical protein
MLAFALRVIAEKFPTELLDQKLAAKPTLTAGCSAA